MTVLGVKPSGVLLQGRIVPAGVSEIVTAFEYFRLKDQAGVSWYWFFSPGYDPDWSKTRPNVPSSREVQFFDTPYWLRLVSDVPETWYFYPSMTDGAPISSPTQPLVGEYGLSVSPELHVDTHHILRYVASSGGDIDKEVVS